MKLTKKVLSSRSFSRFLYHAIRSYSSLNHMRVEGEKEWQEYLENGGTILLCTWHQQFFSLIRHFKTYTRYNPGLMISQSRDGDIIARVANLTGWKTARGSSSRGGKAAMDAMIDHMRQYRLGAHILDGPRGPAGIVKPGVIRIAMDSGAAIVPMTVKAEKAWYAKSWDRFMLPRPLTTVTCRFHDRIEIKPSDSEEVFEQYRNALEEYMRPFLVDPDQ